MNSHACSNNTSRASKVSLCSRETCSLSRSLSWLQFVVPIRISSASEAVSAGTVLASLNRPAQAHLFSADSALVSMPPERQRSSFSMICRLL